MSKLDQALAARFTDIDEMRDVVKHGCIAGVNGFIYSTELNEFFNEHEQEIEETLDAMEVQLDDLVDDVTDWTFQQLRERSVWTVVEEYCYRQLDA